MTTTMYFGTPGSLVEIPHPRGGLKSTRLRPRTVFKTAGGGARVGQMAGGKRQYTLNWRSLQYETFATLLAYDQGHSGVGPFALLDPGQTNLLTVNQSAATGETNSDDNFTVAGSGGTLTSVTTPVSRGPRAASWNFTYAASGTLTLDSPSTSWSGVPVVVGQAYTFFAFARSGGTAATMSLTPRVAWYSDAGSLLSTSTGTPITPSSTYAETHVNATAPASAAYGLCSFTCTGQNAGSIVYLDRLQLQFGTVTPVSTDWRPGTGVVPVQVLGMDEGWGWAAPGYRESPTLVLQEVGP